jgi:hypothetical protein
MLVVPSIAMDATIDWQGLTNDAGPGAVADVGKTAVILRIYDAARRAFATLHKHVTEAVCDQLNGLATCRPCATPSAGQTNSGLCLRTPMVDRGRSGRYEPWQLRPPAASRNAAMPVVWLLAIKDSLSCHRVVPDVQSAA